MKVFTKRKKQNLLEGLARPLRTNFVAIFFGFLEVIFTFVEVRQRYCKIFHSLPVQAYMLCAACQAEFLSMTRVICFVEFKIKLLMTCSEDIVHGSANLFVHRCCWQWFGIFLNFATHDFIM